MKVPFEKAFGMAPSRVVCSTWNSVVDKASGKAYWYNTETMETSWENPEKNADNSQEILLQQESSNKGSVLPSVGGPRLGRYHAEQIQICRNVELLRAGALMGCNLCALQVGTDTGGAGKMGIQRRRTGS